MCNVGQIIAIRAQVEELTVDEECLVLLGDIGQRTSLRFETKMSLCPYYQKKKLVMSSLNRAFTCRHAVQLLSPSSIVAKMNGRDSICKVIVIFLTVVVQSHIVKRPSVISLAFQHMTGWYRGSNITVPGCQIFSKAFARATRKIHLLRNTLSNAAKKKRETLIKCFIKIFLCLLRLF